MPTTASGTPLARVTWRLRTHTIQIIAFVAGFLAKDVFLTMWTATSGVLLTTIVVIPPWPMYNKHPVPWLFPGGVEIGVDVGDHTIIEETKKSEGSKKPGVRNRK